MRQPIPIAGPPVQLGCETARAIEAFRPMLAANLDFAWIDADLAEPVWFCLVIADAPSPTKEALSLGLLSGTLAPDGAGLSGDLELTALGRLVVRRWRRHRARERKAVQS